MASASELNTILIPFLVVTVASFAPLIPHCYDHEPAALQGEPIPLMLQDSTGHIHYWTVQADSTSEAWRTNEQCDLIHDLCIRGYKERVTPSIDQPAFQALASLLADRFRPAYAVGPAPTMTLLGPAQTPKRALPWRISDTWPGYHTELRLRAIERVTIPFP